MESIKDIIVKAFQSHEFFGLAELCANLPPRCQEQMVELQAQAFRDLLNNMDNDKLKEYQESIQYFDDEEPQLHNTPGDQLIRARKKLEEAINDDYYSDERIQERYKYLANSDRLAEESKTEHQALIDKLQQEVKKLEDGLDSYISTEYLSDLLHDELKTNFYQQRFCRN